MLRSVLLASVLSLCAGRASAVQVLGNITHPSCGQSSGVINVYVTGGQAPFTFVWNDGPTSEDRVDLPPGSYTVTVTDDLGATDSETFVLEDQGLILSDIVYTYAGGFACPGEQDGRFSVVSEVLPGVAPHTISVSSNGSPVPQGADVNGWPTFYGLATNDDVELTVTDNTGCSGNWGFNMYGPLGLPITVGEITPACAGNNGTATILCSGTDWPVDLLLYDQNMDLVYSEFGVTWDVTVTGLAPGDYILHQLWTQWLDAPCGNFLAHAITVPDLGPDCGTMNGIMWYDVNSDCSLDPGEVPVPFSTLLAQPGEHYAITDSEGNFSYHLQNGNYLLYENDPDLVLNCPSVQPVPFAINNNSVQIELPNSSTEPLNIRTYASGLIPRPGFSYGLWATVRNMTPQVSGPITVTCTFDPAFVYQSASPAPSDVSGNVITWDLAAFGPFGMSDVDVVLDVPAGTPLGTVVATTFTATQPLAESDMVDNTFVVDAVVSGSFDPNDKTATTSSHASTTQYFTEGDEWIDYTIRFQNTGTDTAFNVVITDVIAPELNMASFEQGTASHAFHVSFKPGRVVEWRFENILLPDSNTNEPASHGLVNFRIRPAAPLVVGTFLINQAEIFFDANEPVATNEAVLVVEAGTATEAALAAQDIHLWPNPAKDHVVIGGERRSDITGITILTAEGRVLRRMSALPSALIPVGDLAAGVYVVRVDTRSGERVLRFVKE